MQLYKISFPDHSPGKVYIGISSKSAAARFKEHCASRKGYPIVQALRKYGKENAVLEVLGFFESFDSLYAAEQQSIKHHNSKAPNGYNLTDGGKGAFGFPASDERKLKISMANKGRKASEETRRKISQANRGRDFAIQVQAMASARRGQKCTPETKEKMRAARLGKRPSEETKRKMSESASKRRASDETRKSMSEAMIAKNGGKIYQLMSPEGQRFDVSEMGEFCRAKCLTKNHMYRVASGAALTHKGWSRV